MKTRRLNGMTSEFDDSEYKEKLRSKALDIIETTEISLSDWLTKYVSMLSCFEKQKSFNQTKRELQRILDNN